MNFAYNRSLTTADLLNLTCRLRLNKPQAAGIDYGVNRKPQRANSMRFKREACTSTTVVVHEQRTREMNRGASTASKSGFAVQR